MGVGVPQSTEPVSREWDSPAFVLYHHPLSLARAHSSIADPV